MFNTNTNADNVTDKIMSNNKQSIMSNPFLQDGESTHEYNNQIFVVDYYPHTNGVTWQCCDANHYFRTRANTKEEAIKECHKKWDKYKGCKNEME